MRQGNVFFAGEHTSLDFQGWMEGAASEGERAGVEMLASMKKQAPAAARYGVTAPRGLTTPRTA